MKLSMFRDFITGGNHKNTFNVYFNNYSCTLSKTYNNKKLLLLLLVTYMTYKWTWKKSFFDLQ